MLKLVALSVLIVAIAIATVIIMSCFFARPCYMQDDDDAEEIGEVFPNRPKSPKLDAECHAYSSVS